MAKNKNNLKPVDAPVYRYWSALLMSFYSKNLYIDVGKRWRGTGLLYLLLAVAVFAIPYSLKMSHVFDRGFTEQFIQPILKMPAVYVQNGEVSFDKPMPYMIKNDKQDVVIIIDTTGKITEFTNQYPHLTMLITKNALLFSLPVPSIMALDGTPANRAPPVVQPFTKRTNMVFDGKSLVSNNSFYGLKRAAQLMIYPIVVSAFYSLFVVFFLVLAFLGQVFSRIFFSFPLDFKTSSRLFMVASTPMLFILIMLLLCNLIFPGLGYILLIVLCAYFGFAIYALRSESRRMVSQ